MSETLLNRARLNNAPQGQPFSTPNSQSQVLLDGVVATAPLVALAYSYAVLEFEGNATHSGNKITIECNDNSITIVLDRWGQGTFSLVPFIRDAIAQTTTLDNPLYCNDTSETQSNGFRGFIDISITEDGREPVAMRVYYIFGNYAPKGEQVTDLYFDYDPDGGTWCNVDDIANYTASGVPTAFEDNWCNINEIVAEEPTGDFMMPLLVAWYYGKDDIQFNTINYHFRYDCRVDNMLKLRWLDNNGNINTRKFVVGGRSHGASTGSTWQRYHAFKEIVDGYDRGRDEWAEMTAAETLTVGDDSIPMTHFNWLKSLASTACADVFVDGAWTRCNINGATIECDPRKATFSVSLTLTMPTDDVQQF